MDVRARIHQVGELLDEARVKYKSALPGRSAAALMDRLSAHMAQWGAWGQEEFGYTGQAHPAPEAKRAYGMAFKEINSWAKAAKFQRENVRGAAYWIRGREDPVIRLSLEDEDGLKYISVVFIRSDQREAENLLDKVDSRTDRILVDWDTDAAKLMGWFKRLGMKHGRVGISGLKHKADRFNADMGAAELQKLLGVAGRFANKQGGLRETTKQQPGEREFTQSVFKRWERPKREVGITVRADEYTQKHKDRRGGKGFYVTVLMWPAAVE